MQTNALNRLGGFVEPRDGEPTDLLGVPVRVHYVLVGALAFAVGGVSLAFALTPAGAPLREPVVIAICLAGMLVPLIFAIAAKHYRYEYKEWLMVGVFLLAVFGPFICSFYIGDLKPVFLTLYMLGPIGVAYYVPLRRGWPVIAAGAAAILYVSAQIDEPDAMARGVIVVSITLATALMLAAIRASLERAVESNREISERDPLTGAHNLHRFHEQLDIEIEHSNANLDAFTLVEFDLDEFGEVNAEYGREAGDQVLIAAAEAIQSTLTPWDLLVRRGADQFVVIAPFISSRNLHATTLLARDRISAARRAICPDLPSTACAGWATHERGESAAALLKRADQTLRDTKYAVARSSRESAVWRDLREVQAPEQRGEVHATAEVLELRRRRAEQAAIGDDPMIGAMRIAWRTAAYSTLGLSLALLIMGLTGNLSFSLSAKHYAIFFGWTCVLAPLALWVTKRRRANWIEHVLCVGSLAMTTATCMVAGAVAPATVEMFMMAALLYLTILPFRYAVVYVGAAYVLYATFLFANDYPHAGMRSITTLLTFSMVGTLLALTRHSAIEAAEEKAHLANTDALTGIANERRLRSWLEDEIEREEHGGRRVAILNVDIDDFKTLNDFLGYSTGDAVLTALAKAIDQAARPGDLAARLEGDNFVLALANSDDTDADSARRQIAEAVKAEQSSRPLIVTPRLNVILTVHEPGESPRDLLARAEEDLHEAA